MIRPVVSLADLLRVAGVLGLDGEGMHDVALRRRTAELLGLTIAPLEPTPRRERTRKTASAESTDVRPPIGSPRPERPAAAAVPAPPRSGTSGAPPRRLTRLTSRPAAPIRSAPPRRTRPLADLLAPGRESAVAAVETGLFVKRWRRAILSTAARTDFADGPVDVDAVIARIAKGRAFAAVPRASVPSLRRGVQLLVDVGPGMRPFAADADDLRAAVRATVGECRLDVLEFEACPLRGAGRGSRVDWREYEPPAAGTPVLVLSDLGISPIAPEERASVSEWVRFAATIARSGCPLFAFTPYGRERWPKRFRHSVHPIRWDRKTNTGTVQRVKDRVVRSAQ